MDSKRLLLLILTVSLLLCVSKVLATTSPPSLCIEREATPRRICRQTGNVRKNGVFVSKQSTTLPDENSCRDICLRREAVQDTRGELCFAYSFNVISKLCTLYLEPIQNSANVEFQPDPDSNTTFWVRNCWDCPNGCPQPTSYDLLDNGGFETSFAPPTPWNSVSFKAAPGFNSSRSARCKNTDFNSQCLLYQYFNTCPNQLYAASFVYKIDYSKPPAQLDYIEASSPQIFTSLPLYQYPNGLWTSGEILFLGDSSSGFDSIQFSSSATSKFFVSIDNVAVHPAALQRPGREILVNGGFEKGVLAPWTPFCEETFYQLGCGPGNSMRARLQSPGLGGSRYSVGKPYNINETHFAIAQPVSLAAGQRYMFSVDYSGFSADGFRSVSLLALNSTYDGRLSDVVPVNLLAELEGTEGTITQYFVPPVHIDRVVVAANANYYSRPPKNDKPQPRLDNISIRPLT